MAFHGPTMSGRPSIMSPGLSTIDLSSLTGQLEAVQVKMLPYTMATKP